MKFFKRIALWQVLLAVFLVVGITGCLMSKPIYNINNDQIISFPSMPLNKAGELIRQAGATRGWAMSLQKPGHIVATLMTRSHTVAVDIYYTTNTFSIVYKSSSNLDYDPSTNTIHRNYNRWVRNLEKAILLKLSNTPGTVESD
jgi:hypothetical protein